MNRHDAEITITEYLKPIFGFALNRCKNEHDAEDLAQEIILRAFRALLAKEDIADIGKYIWTIAHNALNNYYRASAKGMIGISIDEAAEWLAAPDSTLDGDDNMAVIHRLQGEIAHLSALQRQIIIAYYFDHRKQTEIAEQMNIPLGTVKWHLFEAKKELKRGMDTMRKTSELKFNPIKFHTYGINGSIGTKNLDDFFRSTLSQNICYCVRNMPKTINEIADDLGVSPVYITPEVEYLAEYGFLRAQKDKYIVNFIISEPTAELLIMQNNMYRSAAERFANDLYDELISSGILDDPDIICEQTDTSVALDTIPRADRNFLLWTLIPYIAAESGEGLIDLHISFEEAATIRPDGAHNICHAAVVPDYMILPDDYVYMHNWCGPMRIGGNHFSFWQVDSAWSIKRILTNGKDFEAAMRTMTLYARERSGVVLPKEDYAWLAERGQIKTAGEYGGHFRSAWQIIILGSEDIRSRLLAIGERIKCKYKDEFDAIKAPYVDAVLNSVPAHLKKIKQYELQFLFHSDGWFLLHCITVLLNNGKLLPPTEEQKKTISTLISAK